MIKNRALLLLILYNAEYLTITLFATQIKLADKFFHFASSIVRSLVRLGHCYLILAIEDCFLQNVCYICIMDMAL